MDLACDGDISKDRHRPTRLFGGWKERKFETDVFDRVICSMFVHGRTDRRSLEDRKKRNKKGKMFDVRCLMTFICTRSIIHGRTGRRTLKDGKKRNLCDVIQCSIMEQQNSDLIKEFRKTDIANTTVID